MRRNSVCLAVLILVAACAAPLQPVPASTGTLLAAGDSVLVSSGVIMDGSSTFVPTAVPTRITVTQGPGGASYNLSPKSGSFASGPDIMIQVVPAGSYRLSVIDGAGVTYGVRRPADLAAMPASFTVAPGEVLYLGDLDIRRAPGGR